MNCAEQKFKTFREAHFSADCIDKWMVHLAIDNCIGNIPLSVKSASEKGSVFFDRKYLEKRSFDCDSVKNRIPTC